MAHRDFSDFVQCNTALRPVKQRNTRLFFQAFHGSGKRGLADVKTREMVQNLYNLSEIELSHIVDAVLYCLMHSENVDVSEIVIRPYNEA